MKKIAPDDPETKSAEVIAANIDQLKLLFPEAFTEGKVDFEVLKQILGGAIDEREEKYGLNWHGKRRARQIALTPSLGTLRPCPVESVDCETTQNLMIEGDNLEVLKLLQKSYAGNVKLIYIDPPYNTGKEFVYPDNFQDNIKNYLELTGQLDGDGRKTSTNSESSGRFHTDWLNMMYPRLRLARSLLREDGVIFVSIDDNEISNLRSILNDVYGSENFVCQICVVSNPRGRQSETIATTHEYLVCYARNSELSGVRGQALTDEQMKDYKFTAADGRKYRTRGLRHRGNASRRVDRPKMYYPLFVNPGSREVPMERTKEFCEEVLPRKSTGEDGRWEWGPDTARQRLSVLEGVLISGRDEWDVFQREFLEAADGDERTTKWKSVWDENSINYQNGKTELKSLFPEAPFDFPKPTYLLRKIIEGCTDSDDLVVDFFGGSGTTAQSTFEVNVRDGNARRFVLVPLPEPTGSQEFPTISALTKERLRRAGKKIRDELTTEGTKKTGGDEQDMFSSASSLPAVVDEDSSLTPARRGPDLDFRVFKLDSTNIRAWDPNRENLFQTLLNSVEHVKADRTEQDILFELLLKLGLELTVPIEQKTIAGKTVHSVGVGTLFVCLAPEITHKEIEPLAHGIADWRKELAPVGEAQVVFRDSAFADDVAKTNITAILAQRGLDKVRSL